ncbi:kinase-like domain-containing protein [Rhodocollybia butyracea]|uniref:Kinase-like domain-containing protein n=1 Tax=Rhodocollybia butyracea TaxID=206335 RepID=A0A9P5P3G5_9AGAR|nr:kinase-like domain-containing protein [Rhodocollybia butyracea]
MIKGLLTEYLKSNDKFDLLTLTKGVASGVAFLHFHNLVHGDIRAASILIDNHGNPRLADTGLLKILDASPLMPDGGSTSTYRWMAPELHNDPKRTSASDVYAFTVTSWEIYNKGDAPFPGLRELQIGNKILQDDRPPRLPDVGDAIWELWRIGWHKDIGQRPKMSQYVDHLRSIA